MLFNNLVKTLFLSASLALQARAGPPVPKVTAGDFELIQGTTAARGPSHLLANAGPPFFPSADNLIVNTTVPQGTSAALGWIFAGTFGDPVVLDGFAKNITVFVTPPGGVERFVFGIIVGPDTGLGAFCGVVPGFFVSGVIDSSDLGTYTGRWTVEFGTSTQPDSPVDPTTGCGPEPFTNQGVEFFRTWEVVEA